MRWRWIGLAVLTACGFARAAAFVPTQSMALGQSLSGATLLNDSIYVNPASSAFTSVYSVDGSYLFGSRAFGVSILDTKTSGIGGELGYYHEASVSPNMADQGATLGLSGRLSNVFGLGVAGKVLWGPNDFGVNDRTNDIDTGLVANLRPFQFGFTVHNLFGGNQNMDENREWSVGAEWNYQDCIYITAATLSTWAVAKPYQYGFGMTYVSPFYFSLKGGYRIQPDNHLSYWDTGFSFISPRLSLHYSVEFPNQSGEAIGNEVGATVMF